MPFAAGETLTFDVSWSGYLTAGIATARVVEKKHSFGSSAYYIVAEGRPTGLLSKLYTLYYKADTLLDSVSLLPQRGSIYSEEGKRQRYKMLLFDHDQRKTGYELRTATVVTREVAVPTGCQDALSALYVLRTLPMRGGERIRMPVADSGQVYQMQATVAGRERVETGIGPVNARRVLPVIRNSGGEVQGRGLVLWISDDARRLPVKLEADLMVGKFNLLLRQAG